MDWGPAVPPREPRGGCDLVTVDDAIVTGFTRSPLRTHTGPGTVMTGAVHDHDGALVVASQREWAGDPFVPVAGDPERVRIPEHAPRLEGTWLYVGHWTGHFGHFLLEVLTNLWPEPEQTLPGLRGLLAHRSFRGDADPLAPRTRVAHKDPKRMHIDLIDLAGYGGLDLQVVRTRPTRVDHLLVPQRPVLLKSWAKPPAVTVWRRISAAVGTRGPHRRVYLSRTLFHLENPDRPRSNRTERTWDAHLDQAFARAGFHVVHPERLSIRDQVALVRGAEVIAGSSGSALHLAIFAEPGTRVLEVGDARSPGTPMESQRMVDAACGHRTAFSAYGDREGLRAVLTSLD